MIYQQWMIYRKRQYATLAFPNIFKFAKCEDQQPIDSQNLKLFRKVSIHGSTHPSMSRKSCLQTNDLLNRDIVRYVTKRVTTRTDIKENIQTTTKTYTNPCQFVDEQRIESTAALFSLHPTTVEKKSTDEAKRTNGLAGWRVVYPSRLSTSSQQCAWMSYSASSQRRPGPTRHGQASHGHHNQSITRR